MDNSPAFWAAVALYAFSPSHAQSVQHYDLHRQVPPGATLVYSAPGAPSQTISLPPGEAHIVIDLRGAGGKMSVRRRK